MGKGMKTVIFDDLDSHIDLGLIRKGVTIGSPSPKTKTVDIEGADGSLDLTEYFGEIFYENRELEMEFQALDEPDKDVYASTPVPCDLVRDEKGFTVYGDTRQNLWENASGTSNGITVTANENGSMSLSGTATARTATSKTMYNLRAGSQYVLSVDKAITGGSSNTRFYIEFHDTNGDYIDNLFIIVGSGSSLSSSFTAPANMARCNMGVSVAQGDTVSGTYRIMLNEGSTAQPWCPPGLNGVGKLSVMTCGANLLPADESEWTLLTSGLTTISIDGDDITVSNSRGTYQRAYVVMNELAGRTVDIGYESVESDGYHTIQLKYNLDGAVKYISASTASMSHKVPDRATSIWLELYSNNNATSRRATATYHKPYLRVDGVNEYSPLSGFTTTAIDLDGHALNSLPDGTRDELSVDATGAATLVKRVGSVTIPTDAGDVGWDSGMSRIYFSAPNSEYNSDNPERLMCDVVPPKIYSHDPETGTYCITTSNEMRAYVRVDGSTSAANTVSKVGGGTILYRLAEPQVIDLPSVNLDIKRDFHAKFQRLYNALHGKRSKITLSENPSAYYIGRVTVDGWKTNEKTGDITVTANCEPYWYRAHETVVNTSVSGTKTHIFKNLRKRVVPVFELSSVMQIKKGAQSFEATAGTWSDSRLFFGQGETELTFTGNGTVKVTYQERGL